MLSAGLRLVLAVAAPLLGAALVHELRHRRRTAALVAAIAIVVCAGLVTSVASAVSGGGTLERGFGSAIPGVDLTARADSASVTAILVACLAAMLAIPRHRHDSARLAGLLLCLGGMAAVAAAGNLVLVTGGVEVIAAGTLLLRGQHGPGSRSAAILAGLLAGAGVALLAASAELVTAAGSSDLAFVPQGAVAGAVAIAWALGGAALVLTSALSGEGASPARDWAAVGALPAGFLVLLRLQESAGGQLPVNAGVALVTTGLVVAALGAYTARRAASIAAAGRSVVAILSGVLVSLFGGSLAASGTLLAGLFLAIELALLAAPSWNRRPTGWSAATLAVTALPGGAAFAVAAVGAGTVAQRGTIAFPQLLVLCAVLTAAAVVGARALVAPLSRLAAGVPGSAAGRRRRHRGRAPAGPGTAVRGCAPCRGRSRRRRGFRRAGRPGCWLRGGLLRGRGCDPGDRRRGRGGGDGRRAGRRCGSRGAAPDPAAAASAAEGAPCHRAPCPACQGDRGCPRSLARGPATDRAVRRRRRAGGGLVPLMDTNEPLLAGAAFLAAVVVTVVDGRNAVTYAALAAALGLAPSVASLYGGDGALTLIAAAVLAALLGPLSRSAAHRISRMAGIDPNVPVVAGDGGLFGPRSIRVATAVLVLPGASWVSFNIPLGSASTVSGVLFPAALLWGCAGVRLLTARTLADVAVGVAVLGISGGRCLVHLCRRRHYGHCGGRGSVSCASGAALTAGWLRGRHAGAGGGAPQPAS